MARVVYIGNFFSPHTTESHRAWSMQMLGVSVSLLQENKTTKEEILDVSLGADAVFYTHTHQWNNPDIPNAFVELKKRKTPTASVHLDRFVWLDREKDIGKEATWKTQYQFVADASPEAVKVYEAFSLQWFYSPPAVVEKECYQARPDPIRFPHPIVFIGSSVYHSKYPFRQTLLSWLKDTYGEHFAHYGVGSSLGVVRGHDLNVLCATASVVVGDSCFGGRPRYVSDRYYEIRGRGGLLLHPHVEGVDTDGVIPYEPQNLVSLRCAIAFALTHPSYAQEMRSKGFSRVSSQETYTHRMKEILEIVL